MKKGILLFIAILLVSTLFANTKGDVVVPLNRDREIAGTRGEVAKALTRFTVRDADVTLDLTVDSWYSEASWNLWSAGTSTWYYGVDQTFTVGYQNVVVPLTLPDGNYSVYCWDAYGDGGIGGIVYDAGSNILIQWASTDYTTVGIYAFDAVSPYTCTVDVTVDTYYDEGSWNVWDYATSAWYFGTDQIFTYAFENQVVNIDVPVGDYAVYCWDTFGDGGIAGSVYDAGGTLVSWSDLDYLTEGIFAFTYSGPAPPVYPIPFAEGFEGGALPADWNQEYVVGAIDWTYMNGSTFGFPAAAHTGSFNAYFYQGNYSGNTTKLVSPQIDMGTATDVNLTFWHTQATWAGDQDELRVYYKDSAAGTWTMLAEYLSSITAWTEEIIALPNLSGDYYVAFEGLGDYGYGVCLDDVSVALVPGPVGDYVLNTVLDGGNPGGLNTDTDSSTTGWTAITTSPQAANLWSPVQTFPADFTFLFYNQPVTEFKVSQNGLLTFDVTAPEPPPDGNVNLPAAVLPDKTIAMFWDEFTLTPPTGSGDNVYMKIFGAAPNRQLWLKYHSFEYSAYSYAYWGICLEETTNRIYLIDYNYKSGGPGSATVGLQFDATTAIEQADSPNFAFLAGGSGNADNDYYEFIPLIAGAPGYPENPVPASGSTDIATAGDLLWDFGVDTDTYDLWFGPAGAMTEVVTGAAAGATGTYAYSGLAYATNNEWQVICHNAAVDMTTNGSIWNFTTMNDPVYAQVGEGSTVNMSLPMEPFYGYSWSNSIYLASEIMTGGDITGVQYQYQTTGGFGPDAIIVYMGHTTLTEFVDGTSWIPVTTMTEVYNGPFSITPGAGNWVGITFPVPFTYNGVDNLVIGFDENTTGYHSSSDEFWCTPTTPIRGICYYSDSTNPDPFGTLPTANAVRNAFPNVRLSGLVQPNGTLDGYVYMSGTTTPIEGAEVECAGLLDVTDATGYYEIPGILVGIYDATASYTGYVPQTVSVEIFDATVTAQNFELGWSEIALDPLALDVYILPNATDDRIITVTNNGTSDLTYNAGLNFISDRTYEPVIKQRTRVADLSYNEVDRVTSEKEIPAANSDALFDLQFQYPCAVATGEAGVETDGNYIYTTEWNGAGGFFRYNMDGTYVGTFVVAGAGMVRDLAYDGQYFYGAAANTSLFQMDFTPGAEVLVSTITAPVACRGIAYDPVANGFWANNWSTDITLFDMTGTFISSFPCSATYISYYGFAYDEFSAGGPFLWGFSQSLPGGILVQYDIATGLETGVVFDVGTLVGSVGSAGGMFISDACVPGFATIGCLVQNEWIVGLELAVTETWMTISDPGPGVVVPGGTASVTVHFDATDLTLGEVKTGEVVFSSNALAGSPDLIPVTMTVGDAPLTPAVIFSEYIEGSSNNKALEIWNNTGAAIDLADYRIAQSVNGGGWAYWHIFPTGATLADQDVWVMLNDATDPLLFDPLNADEVLAYPSVVHHNGDDARGLEWTPDGGTTWVLIDVIGIPTEDPGTGWDVAGVTNGTLNHTLVRKADIMFGNTDWLASAGTNATDSEWIVYPENTFTYLGQHPYVPPVFDPPTNLFVDDLGYATWDAPGGTTPIGLYAQWDFVSAEGGISAQDFETSFDAYDAEGADEFVVPAGETWTINEVAILGSYSVAGPTNGGNVRIYADNAGMPGTLLFEYLNVPANPDATGNLDCFIPDTALSAGTYWLGFQGVLEYTTGGQWYWTRQAAPTIGYEFHWRNPGGGFGGLTTWGPGSVQWPGQNDYNLSFALFGAQTDANGKTYVRTNPNQNTSEQMLVKANVERNQLRTPTLTGMAYNGAASRTLVGYNVWLDGTFVTYTTDLFHQYTDLTANTTYLAEVTAVYDDPGESDPIDYSFTYMPGPLPDPPTDLFVTEQGYATWTAPGGGSGTVQVDPMAVPYWTGTTNGTALTQTSLVNAMEYEDGWMNFDVSGIPDGSTITEIEFNGYCNATYWSYWDINGVYIDPLTAAPADLLAAITNSANSYNVYQEPSTSTPGWRIDVLGGSANADLAAALANDWFCLGIDSTDDYITYFITFDGWNETLPPFLMVTYEGTDGKVARTMAKALSFEKNEASDDSREVLEGYNVYLDTVFEAYTTDEFYQHDTTGLTNGTDYTTAVEAVYDTGISEQIDYTWTYIAGGAPIITVNPMVINETLDPDEIMVVPMTITNTGTGDLTYNISVDLSGDARSTRPPVRRNTAAAYDVTNTEVDPDWKKVEGFPTDDLFDLQFAYPCAVATGEAGFETDGLYLYSTEWNGAGGFFRYELDGTYVGTFVIPGVAGIRDLAYDGQYFYGAAANTSLRQMDFTMGAEALISTITAPVACRAIAYDDDADAFWANNWSTAITQFSRTGTVLNSFPCGTAISFYGFAYDNYSTDGPFLWGFSQSPAHTVVQFDIATGLETGVTFDVGTVVTLVGGSAGGMFIAEGLVPGYVTLGCLVQNEWLIGLELCPGEEPWLSVDVNSGTVAPGGVANINVTLDATDLVDITKNGSLTIANNAGDDVIVPVTMIVLPGGAVFDPPTNVAVDGLTGTISWFPPANTLIFDDFDDYTVGDYLAVVNPTNWTVWPGGTPGGAADAQISDDFALSGSNSVKIAGTSDMVLLMEDYTSGIYSIEVNLLIPAGNCGYYNLQKTSTPGQEWAFQIQFDVTGIATADAGAAAALTFPFDFDTWINMELVVDLDDDNCDIYVDGTLMHSYQWTLGTFGTAGLNAFGGANLYAWASTGNTPLCYFDDVKLTELVPATDELTNYRIYLDDMVTPVATVGAGVLEYTYTGLVNQQNYVGGVSAVYDGTDESEIIEVPFQYTPVLIFDPPNNLVATVVNYNSVALTWELPGGASEEILYHSGYDNNGIGTGTAVDFICAARFTGTELASYYGGWELTGVNIFLHSMDFSYCGIQVYEGGSYGNPGTLVYDQDITTVATFGAFTNHLLSTPVPLVAGNEYWIGYDISATGDHPAAVDAGPMVPDKGAWMYFSGSWSTLLQLGPTLDFNWVITGIVSETDAVASIGTKKSAVIGNSRNQEKAISRVPEKVISRVHFTSVDAPFEAEFNRSIRRVNTQQSSSRSLAGYRVYRNGTMVHEIFDPAILTWTNTGLNAGNYAYHVTATYTNPNGESVASNVENVVITLPAPQNFNAVSNWPNILCTWTSMPGVQGYNVYQNGTLVTTTTSTFYLHANVPAGTYIYKVAAVFNGGWVGPFSNTVTVVHPPVGTDPILVPLVTSLDGNYPNPFNPTTLIKFGLHEAQKVAIDVYNVKGEKVRTLVNGELEAGFHSILWNGKDDSGKTTASGVYFYKMKAGKFVSTKKMILMK